MSRLRGMVVATLLASSCVDFDAALDECAKAGRCGERSAHDAGGAVTDSGTPDGGRDGGLDGGTDAGCIDRDLDGLGDGCGAPDCDDLDGQRPLQLPCREGAYVCRSCPGASDQNTGSPTAPLRTIAQGLVHARVLGTEVSVANQGRFQPAVYAENLDLVDGIAVVGRFYVEDGGWRYPSPVRTIIQSSRSEGVLFPAGVGRATKLSGFEVRSTGGDAGAGITIRSSSPTLEDVSAGHPVRAADRSYGIVVERRDGGARSNPLLIDTIASSGSAATEAFGLWVRDSEVHMRGGEAHGGAVSTSGMAVGIRLETGRGSSFTNVLATGCPGLTPSTVAPFCRAVHTTGDVSGVVYAGGQAYGCPDECAADAGGDNVGFDIQYCGGAWDGGAAMLVAGNGEILGARRNANGAIARGLRVGEGCAVMIRDNALIAAATTANNNPNAIRCTFGVGGVHPSHCFIVRNTIVSHFAGAPAGGSPVPGAVGILCQSGCDDISNNEIDTYGAGILFPVSVIGGAPLISRNRINMNQTDTSCTYTRGLFLLNSAARVENNFIRGGNCPNAIGLLHTVTSDAGIGADVHSNSIAGGESSTYAFGVYAQGPPGSVAGRYRNNIISTGDSLTSARSSMAFEYDTLPLEVFGNLLHSATTGYHLITRWGYAPYNGYYVNTANQTLPYFKQNISAADPGFRSWRNFHLTAASPAIDAGSIRDGGPLVDHDGDRRPLEDAGYSPAMGADEP